MTSPTPSRTKTDGRARPRGGRRHRTGVVVLSTTDTSLDVAFEGHLARLAQAGFGPVTAASADAGRLRAVGAREGVAVHALPFRRRPTPLADVRALLATVALLVRLRPALVVHGTPKAALLGSVAARLTGVPARVHVWHGLRLETTRGLLRRVLRACERIALHASTHTVAVSHGLADVARDEGLPVDDVIVLGEGSVTGVDVAHHSKRPSARRRAFRSLHGLEGSVPVVGYVGRLTPDKGLDALVSAVAEVRRRGTEARLVLVGPDDGVDELRPETRRLLDEDWVTCTGPVEDCADAFPAFDVSTLPSLREGLGQVVLESWASGVPVVVTDIPALRRIVEDGVTGRVVPVDDVEALATALTDLLTDEAAREHLARRARERVLEAFDRTSVHDRWMGFYGDVVREATTGRRPRRGTRRPPRALRVQA